ncbi:MerR family transcriptional regulator [Bacillus sp. Bva_UNVM-123]|uniref:MerR family transcriptional regulator n=1 Tax=Bacillus sp. Bva_UNVM-123 TaxID=2829798 RepID=UPI00391F5869
MFTIGQVSKKTGVTVRTLDYYDEIGLITPSSTTSGGHRLYDESNVMRLEQVLAFKYMGFTLDEIKEMLTDSTATWKESIEQQLIAVRQKQKILQALEQALEGVLYSIQFEKEVKWDKIFNIIRMFQEDPEVTLHIFEKYFSGEELNSVLFRNEEIPKEELIAYGDIIIEIRNHLHIDPGSEKALQLVQKWLDQVHRMFGNDEALLDKMWGLITDHKDDMCFYPMEADVIEFIERTIEIIQKNEGLKE